MEVAVLVGNPKPHSKTYEASVLLAKKLTGTAPTVVIDVIEFGADLLNFGSERVAESIRTLRRFPVVIVSSPTFKATYTGVLKLYLDQIPSNGLSGTIALPLMLGAGPSHALAADLLLKPVLVELGAICPVQGLYLLDSTFMSDPRLDEWICKTKSVLDAYLLGKK